MEYIINIGDSLYLSHKKVIVCDIIEPFRLAVVHYERDLREFVVDQGAPSLTRSQTRSIPITLFKGDVS